MSEKEKKEHDKEKKPKGPKPEGKGHGEKGGGEKKARKPKGPALAEEVADEGPQQPVPPARLYERYKSEIAPALGEKIGQKNRLAVPRLEKIVISMGVGRFAVEGGEGKAKMQQAEKELSVIAGQKPVRTKAKKSVANFKVREGMETGLKVTLRGQRMYEFLDRMITLAIPRVKDFRGLDPNGFDKAGNYNFGFTEQTVFPEVNAAEVTFQQGMNITMVTTAKNPDQGRDHSKISLHCSPTACRSNPGPPSFASSDSRKTVRIIPTRTACLFIRCNFTSILNRVKLFKLRDWFSSSMKPTTGCVRSSPTAAHCPRKIRNPGGSATRPANGTETRCSSKLSVSATWAGWMKKVRL